MAHNLKEIIDMYPTTVNISSCYINRTSPIINDCKTLGHSPFGTQYLRLGISAPHM